MPTSLIKLKSMKTLEINTKTYLYHQLKAQNLSTIQALEYIYIHTQIDTPPQSF